MNKFITKNINIICTIFIIMGPIIDFITGLCIHILDFNLTIGSIFRMLFLGFISYTTIFIYKKKKVLKYYIFFFIYLILYIMGIILFKNNPSYFNEIKNIFRVFYFPLLLICIFNLKEDIKITSKTLIITLILYLTLIFIPLLFNIGFKSYSITKVGTLGFFNSANEISAIISIITPLLFIFYKENSNLVLRIFIFIMYFIVIVMIGTKTPLLALILTLMLVLIYIIINCYKQKKYKTIAASIVALLITLVILIPIIPKTNFYKNIEVHLDFLEIDNIKDVFKDKELIDHFIFSERLTFLKNKKEIYNNLNIYEKLIGIGYYDNNKEIKSIEMDYYDIFYSHGIIGFILFFVPYIYILIDSFRLKRNFDFNHYMIYTSVFLIIILTFFTGHIIVAPAVSSIVVMIILLLSKSNT